MTDGAMRADRPRFARTVFARFARDRASHDRQESATYLMKMQRCALSGNDHRDPKTEDETR
ncbi:MAG: hypothetical protein JNL94_14545 [Planctomycetes bacterium]|nr:hypothetical protein [Planctomycetota bacterium]